MNEQCTNPKENPMKTLKRILPKSTWKTNVDPKPSNSKGYIWDPSILYTKHLYKLQH